MENGWKRLAKEWDGHAVGLVADVDCTTDRGKALCDLYDEEPNRYPTLKYGDPSALDVYRNDRTYEALSNFAKENLKPICSVDNVEVCDAKEKSQIETYMKLNVEELHTAIKNGKDRFNDAVAKLKEAYMEEYNKLEAGAKVSSRLVKFVLDAKSKDEEEEDFCHGCKVEF
jgi:hypothetical protein